MRHRTHPLDTMTRLIGHIEGTLEGMTPRLDQIHKKISHIENRLQVIEHAQVRWRTGAAVVFSTGSIMGSLLPYLLTHFF